MGGQGESFLSHIWAAIFVLIRRSVVYLADNPTAFTVSPQHRRHANNNSEKEHKQAKRTQPKPNPGKTEKKNNLKSSRAGGGRGGVAEGARGTGHTHGRHTHGPGTDTDRLALTVTVPVRLAARLCHLEMLKQSLQGGRGRRQRSLRPRALR